MIRYLLELLKRSGYKPELALASAEVLRDDNIYVIGTGWPVGSTYWTAWGGTYDNPQYPMAQILFDNFLTEVATLALCIALADSFFVSPTYISVNILKKPWQYFAADTEYSELELYSSNVKNPENPSDITYQDIAGNNIPVPVRLEIPKVGMSLSDVFSGIVLNSTFSVNLINNDGFFDNIQQSNYFNTPASLKRTMVDLPELADFETIRYGFVNYVDAAKDDFTINVADIFKALSQEVTSPITAAAYPGAPAESIGKPMPLGWGSLIVPLINVGADLWLAVDPAYLVSVDAVYDSSGSSIAYSVSGGIIDAVDADYAEITCLATNRIGEIIVNEMAAKSNIPYAASTWDLVETNAYKAASYKLNLYFKSGSLKNLIAECLKSDMAFLITKNDGRLTLRGWGTAYGSHVLAAWQLMEFPRKSTQDAAKLYNSSVNIYYGLNNKTNKWIYNYLDDTEENALEEIYRRKNRATFYTNLAADADAIDLAGRVLDRFKVIYETIPIKLGVSAADIDLVDTITLPMVINNRTFSNYTTWAVISCDPGQDTLTILSIS